MVKPWRTINGEEMTSKLLTGFDVLIRGMFGKRRFLDLLHNFIVFEDDGSEKSVKKMAGLPTSSMRSRRRPPATRV